MALLANTNLLKRGELQNADSSKDFSCPGLWSPSEAEETVGAQCCVCAPMSTHESVSVMHMKHGESKALA